MIQGLANATIWSEDLTKKLLPFYRDTVGLPVANDTPGFVVMGSGENAPSLCLGTHSDVKGNNGDPARHMIGLRTDDTRAEYERLKAAGVEFVDEPTDFGGVIVATFKDPEGNLVQLLQFTG
jgi:predicted enzyme related to lactoylglutathione lyase